MALPGLLEDLSPAQIQQWDQIVAANLKKTIGDAKASYASRGFDLPTQVVADGDPQLQTDIVQQDWPGFPIRYEKALGRSKTETFLQHHSAEGVQGRLGHEEYIEWRDVRDANGKLLRVEMTTETQDYWSFLASVDPSQTLQLLADFAGVTSIDPADVYGTHDPFSGSSTPALRRSAFAAQMTRATSDQPVRSPYNNGARAIAFMANRVNSLYAAINLTAFGGYPFGTPGDTRALTGGELIATLPFGAAADCRNSDPNIFGTAISAAWEGRKIALADPAGIYIKQAGSPGDLLLPDMQTDAPMEWFDLSRGTSITQNGSNISLYQRLVVAPDPASGLVLGDLILSSTEEPVKSGVDIARLVTIALYLKTSAAQANPAFQKVGINPRTPSDCGDANSDAYGDVHATYQAWLDDQSTQNLSLPAMPMRGQQ